MQITGRKGSYASLWKFYKNLECNQIFKCCIENEALKDEGFAYFIANVYVKESNKNEMESSLKYYNYGYNMDFSKVYKLYLVSAD